MTLFLFLERSRIATSSLIQQVSMVTRDINILYVPCHVEGAARRCVQKTPRGTALMWMALCSQLNICFWLCSRRGRGAAQRAVYSTHRCISMTAMLQAGFCFVGLEKQTLVSPKGQRPRVPPLLGTGWPGFSCWSYLHKSLWIQIILQGLCNFFFSCLKKHNWVVSVEKPDKKSSFHSGWDRGLCIQDLLLH